MTDVRLYRGNHRVGAIDPLDRGLAYGDGVFETMRMHAGHVHWWPLHRQRLLLGVERLGLPLPDMAMLDSEIATVASQSGNGVLKLLLTRGGGGRGYAPPVAAEAAWQLSTHPLPVPAPSVDVAWCTLRIAEQPALAGIKHCNRLEQVLARREVAGLGADEGLLCDAADALVGATSANVVVLQQGKWSTPPVDRHGIAGVCRRMLLESGLVLERTIPRADVEAADAVFLCNAVRGILPVRSLGTRRFADTAALRPVREALRSIHPAFQHDPEETA